MESKEKIILVLTGIIVVICVIVAVAGLRKPPATMPESTGLKIEDLTVGTGAEATSGATLTVNYKGTLVDGTQFDSSYDRGEPFKFTLGAGQVIAGWDQGFLGMKVGDKRKLTIPPELGYGSRATGPIPANSTLIFDVELLGVN